ncbi:MAG TPA: DsrE family protein [Paludibacter sp.]|nr:DsrE family protein [Paludibacter sp.]
MKQLRLFVVAGILGFACTGIAGQVKPDGNRGDTEATEPKEGVFIHVTESYNNPRQVLMPMKMAVLMAVDKDVVVYMDLKSVELLVKGARDLSYPDFESFQAYMKVLTGMGVKIYACPICLKISGYAPADLMDGVKLARKEELIGSTKGRVISMDY